MMTGNMTTVARPYAIGAFEYALATQSLPAWEKLLHMAALLTEDRDMSQLLMNPHVLVADHVELYCDLLKILLDKDKKNFIYLLAEKKRLGILPGIYALFKRYQAEYEKTLEVEVISAVSLDTEYQNKLKSALTERLKKQIALRCTIDTNLLGGVMIKAGDTVIDGSIRGQLNRMNEFISGISLR